MLQEITIPDLGNQLQARILDVLVKVGDLVNIDDTLLVLESEKASIDFPSPYKGKIKKIFVNKGELVSIRQAVIVIDVLEDNHNDNIVLPKQVIEVVVPNLGIQNLIKVIDIHVECNKIINKDDSLITLEGEKVSIDIPSPVTGSIISLWVELGQKVQEGDLIVLIETCDNYEQSVIYSPQEKKAQSCTKVLEPNVGANDCKIISSNQNIHASPSVRRLAREFGVELSFVIGSGKKGRLLSDDIKKYVKTKLQEPKLGQLQAIDLSKYNFEKYGVIEVQELSNIKKLTGDNLYINWSTIPQVTHFDEVDITQLEHIREEQNNKHKDKLTPIVFIIKALVHVMKVYPFFNATFNRVDKNVILKKYYNFGIAVDTEQGLVVPVIKNVDQKDIFLLTKELREISKKARSGLLNLDDLAGRTFTISSLGGIGGVGFTPIINYPDAAIIGISKIMVKPIFINGKFEPRKVLPFAITYDHRIIDGAQAARFCQAIVWYLTDPNNFLFE